MRRIAIAWAALAAACGGGGSSHPAADAPADTAPADAAVPSCVARGGEPVACDFSCAGNAWPATAPDPLAFTGSVQDPLAGAVGGAQVTVRAVAGDTVLGQAMSASSDGAAGLTGSYELSVATGGTAPVVYRTATLAGNVDGYELDPAPAFDAAHAAAQVPSLPGSALAQLYQMVHQTVDPARGTVIVYVRDCQGAPVANATVDAPGAAGVYYENASQIITPATTTATGIHGWAYVLGVPAGSADLAVHAGATTYRPWPVTVVAGAITSSPRVP